MHLMILMAWGWGVMALLMTVLWLVQRRTGNAAIVDVGWPLGVPILANLYFFAHDAWHLTALLTVGAAELWGIRLAGYLYLTRIHGGRVEEGRYRTLRDEWGPSFQIKLFGFFQLQAFLDVLFALPFLLIVQAEPSPPDLLTWIALALFALAFTGEAVADWQLHRFKARPENSGAVCDVGLWSLSRHPNYFFELTIWVAFALMALPHAFGWLALLCPLLMAFFLFRVTGIPATEAQALRSKGEAYRRYMNTVSPFVPWFPRRTREG